MEAGGEAQANALKQSETLSLAVVLPMSPSAPGLYAMRSLHTISGERRAQALRPGQEWQRKR